MSGFPASLAEVYAYLTGLLGITTQKSDSALEGLTILGYGCKFEGEMDCPERTIIDGKVMGKIIVHKDLTIGKGAEIRAPRIEAKDILIAGRVEVEESIKAQSLELKETAELFGDIEIKTFSVEQGALFEGKCSMKR